MAFNKAVQLFNHHDAIYGRGKILELLIGQRPDHAELQNADIVLADLADILIAGAGGDDAELSIRSLFPTVEIGSFGIFGNGSQPRFHNGMALFGKTGHHNIFRRIFFIRFLR